MSSLASRPALCDEDPISVWPSLQGHLSIEPWTCHFRQFKPAVKSVLLLLWLLLTHTHKPTINTRSIIDDAVKSTNFAACSVTAYQIGLCVHGYLLRRKLLPEWLIHRYVYALIGSLSSVTVLMERAERRPEATLFVPFNLVF